jgi:uncharacterized membrane protein
MENNEKMMTGEESLKIITEMINRTKVNIRQGSFHLLFWGWLITVCSLSEWLIAKLSSYPHPYYVWILVIPGAFVSMIYGAVTGRKAKVQTYADKLYMWTWIGFLFAAIVLFIVQSDRMENITPYILLLAGFPTFLSGFIVKFKPLIAGGICFWVIAILVHFAGPSLALLGTPVAMFTGYLIPGYMLRNKVNHDTV